MRLTVAAAAAADGLYLRVDGERGNGGVIEVFGPARRNRYRAIERRDIPPGARVLCFFGPAPAQYVRAVRPRKGDDWYDLTVEPGAEQVAPRRAFAALAALLAIRIAPTAARPDVAVALRRLLTARGLAPAEMAAAEWVLARLADLHVADLVAAHRARCPADSGAALVSALRALAVALGRPTPAADAWLSTLARCAGAPPPAPLCNPDPLEVLGLPADLESLSDRDLSQAWHRAARQSHPDCGPGNGARWMFDDVRDAWEVVHWGVARRREFDQRPPDDAARMLLGLPVLPWRVLPTVRVRRVAREREAIQVEIRAGSPGGMEVRRLHL